MTAPRLMSLYICAIIGIAQGDTMMKGPTLDRYSTTSEIKVPSLSRTRLSLVLWEVNARKHALVTHSTTRQTDRQTDRHTDGQTDTQRTEYSRTDYTQQLTSAANQTTQNHNRTNHRTTQLPAQPINEQYDDRYSQSVNSTITDTANHSTAPLQPTNCEA